ncbi:hypothetical protein SARC_12921 [Sphaeroforma arctica JP610]|uniref:Uncharacterized protein n=1 Tax=Sphaeroforma arctica JP610 TaxID=667725 RepID=A0A0L0FCN4_9EUKA|nr:hypothetical protein SARC_12921 [Sphaeroforma arctica JP610]KNC74537.1 hypothetical protein SARC_12921 [Sphaeroforma arctica JP610]|eukprot:XP_014148439.1 hypothetical protein SARC_12921 [Sphaeroforma arctica JP610]
MHRSRRNSPANRDSSNPPPHHEINGYTTHRDRPMSMQLGAPVGHTYHADGPSNRKSWRSIASRTISVDAAHFNFDEPPIHTAPFQSPSSELSLNALNDSAGVQSKKRGSVENKSTDPKARAGSSAITPSRTATPTNAKLNGTTSDVQSNATDMFGEPIIGAEIGGGLSDALGMVSTGSLPVQKEIVTKRESNASDDYKLGPPDEQKPLAAKSWRDLAKLNFNKKHYTFDQRANGTDSSGHNSPDSVSSARGSFEFGLNAIAKTVKTGIASPRENTHTATTYSKNTHPSSFSASESEADRSTVQFVNSIGAKAKAKTKTKTKTQTQTQTQAQNQNQNQGPGSLSNPNTSDEDNSSQAYNKRTRALKSKLLTIQSVGSALERGIDATEDERRAGESPQSPTLLSTVTSEDSFSANVLGSAHPEEINSELQRINEAAMRVCETELLGRTQTQTQTQTQPGGGLHTQTSGGLHTQAGGGTDVDGKGNGNGNGNGNGHGNGHGNGNGTVEKDQESSERSESKESLRAQQHAVVTRSPSYAHTHARPHSQSKALDIRRSDNGGEAGVRMHEVLYGHRNGTNSAQKTHEDLDTETKAKAKITVRRRGPGRTTAERPKSASYSCLHVPSNGTNGNGNTPKFGHHARSLASPHSLTDLLSPRPITPRAKTSMTYAAAGMFVNDAV